MAPNRETVLAALTRLADAPGGAEVVSVLAASLRELDRLREWIPLVSGQLPGIHEPVLLYVPNARGWKIKLGVYDGDDYWLEGDGRVMKSAGARHAVSLEVTHWRALPEEPR